MLKAQRKTLPQLRAVPMPLFPTMGSLQDVMDFADTKLPINTKNDITTLLMTYHNTLLQQVHSGH